MSHYDKRHVNKVRRDASIIRDLEREMRQFDKASKGTISGYSKRKKITDAF